MKTTKIAYGADVVRMVLRLYGRDSEVYKTMVEGKFISKLIKADIKKKSGNRCGQNFKAKKELLAIVKEKEAEYDQLFAKPSDVSDVV